MAEASDTPTGKKQRKRDVIGIIHRRLQAASDVEPYLQQAQEQGDAEVLEFLRDYQEAQRDLAERASNLLGARKMRTASARKGARSQTVEAQPEQAPVSAAAVPTTNAQVPSGRLPGEDLADEDSMESFPASDAPARY